MDFSNGTIVKVQAKGVEEPLILGKEASPRENASK